MTVAARRSLATSLALLWSVCAHAQNVPADASVGTNATGPATSQSATTQVDPTRNEARSRFQRGVSYIEAERWADAIIELQAARELRVTPSVMYNLGLAYRAVGRNREAMAAFREFIRLSGVATNPEFAQRVDAYIRELASGLGRIELQVEPASARVLIDGSPVREHEPIEVDPGRHVIVAEAEGYASETRTLEVSRGVRSSVLLRMVPTVLSSRVTVRAQPSTALVRIDGQSVGFGNIEEIVRPGTHTLDVSADGFSAFHRNFEAVAGQAQVVSAALSSNRTVFQSPWFWLGAGAIAAGAGIAAYFLLQDTAAPYRGTLGTVTDAVTVGGWR